MSEETDALNQRIRDLTEQVSVLERKAAETGDMLERMTANGLDKLLTGRGFFEFGGGVTRLDQTGLQVAGNSNTQGVWFTNNFFQKDSLPATYGVLYADNLWGTRSNLKMHTEKSGSIYADVGINTYTDDSADVTIEADTTGYYALIQCLVSPDPSGFGYVIIDPALQLYPKASDPARVFDGNLWYRSDTDKFRARINGVTENLATESYVAANAGGSSWTGKKVLSAASTNATSVKASSGTLGPIVMVNTNASVRYLKLYDKASAPTVGTDTPKLTFALPSGVAVALSTDTGIPFGTGIAYALTTGAADSDTAAVAANEITGVICYA